MGPKKDYSEICTMAVSKLDHNQRENLLLLKRQSYSIIFKFRFYFEHFHSFSTKNDLIISINMLRSQDFIVGTKFHIVLHVFVHNLE